MVRLQIVATNECAARVPELLEASPSVWSVVCLGGAARKPAGDLIICDVAREDANVLIDDLRELDIPSAGSILDRLHRHRHLRRRGRGGEARRGPPVGRGRVGGRRAAQRGDDGALGHLHRVHGAVHADRRGRHPARPADPDRRGNGGRTGVRAPRRPLGGARQRRPALIRRSLAALALGFPVGIAVTLVVTLLFDGADVVPESFNPKSDPLTGFISQPDFFSSFVTYIAGTAGILALTSAKSGALIGVLISVTTIPAAADIGVTGALGALGEAGGAATQLSINLASIVLAGVVTLYLQRRLYVSRRLRHLRDSARRRAGLPVGRSRRGVLAGPSGPEDGTEG